MYTIYKCIGKKGNIHITKYYTNRYMKYLLFAVCLGIKKITKLSSKILFLRVDKVCYAVNVKKRALFLWINFPTLPL